jgi:hypothetical protein
MKNRLNALILLISCCSLILTQGCDSDVSNQGFVEQPSAKGKVVVEVDTEDDAKKAPSTDLAPEAPTPIPVPPAPTPVGDGYGGGSQGALKPEDLGNSDEDEDDDGPHGVCGNSIQEVLPDTDNCPFDIYGTTTDGANEPSNLYGFNFNDKGIGGLVGQIGPDLERVTSIDFAPDGTLYGVAIDNDNNDYSTLITINCRTGQATRIGRTNIEDLSGNNELITDIDFDSFGRLYAYVTVDGTPNDDRLVYLDPTTGAYTALTSVSGLEEEGNGIGSTPFPGDNLYHAGTDLHVLDKYTGVASGATAINFPAPANDNPHINSLDADPFTQVVYASLNDNGMGPNENYLTRINVDTGEVTFLSDPPHLAPEGLDGIAVNRRYEECDLGAQTPVLPSGTSCTEDCELFESICDDGLDNDQDGLTDCEDPDCLGYSCNDTNGCTINDTCVSIGAEGCHGTDVDCDDIVGNECVVTECVERSDEPGNNHFKCNFKIDNTKEDFGSCTPQGNCRGDDPLAADLGDDDDDGRNDDGSCRRHSVLDECIAGRCIVNELCPIDEEEAVTCEGASKEVLTLDEGGCVDDNACTADSCLERGECEYETLVGVYCNNGNECDVSECQLVDREPTCVKVNNEEAGTLCDDGNDCTYDQCNGLGSCIGSGVPFCETNADCPSGVCYPAGLVGVCACDNGNPCAIPTCGDRTGECVALSFEPNPIPCDDGNLCTTGETCHSGGVCTGGVPSNSACSEDSCIDDPCVMPQCTANGCENIYMDGPTSCNVGLCPGTIECNNGVPNDDDGCVLLNPSCADD